MNDIQRQVANIIDGLKQDKCVAVGPRVEVSTL